MLLTLFSLSLSLEILLHSLDPNSSLGVKLPRNFGLTFIAIPSNMTISPNTGFGGRIDEVRIWSAYRDTALVTTYYTTSLTGSEANLLAYYNFDDVSAFPTFYDVTPNARFSYFLSHNNIFLDMDNSSLMLLECTLLW
jgi:hypothetical protein